MVIQLWKRKNYNKTKYNLYLRYRANQNKAKVESLKLWEWIKPQNDIQKNHNEEVRVSCKEIVRRAKDDLENNRSSIKLEEPKTYQFKNLFYEFSNINNTNAVFNFIIQIDEQVETISIKKINQKLLESLKNKIEERIQSKDIKGSTASKYWNNFKSVLINLNKLKLCKYPKTRGITYVDEKKPVKVFYDREIEKIKSSNTKKNILRDPFLFSCYTGTKLKIIEHLKWGNIKRNTDKIYFVDIIYGNKKYIIPFKKEIRKLLGRRKTDESYIFKLIKSKKNMSKEFYKLLKDSNVDTSKKYSDAINTFVMKTYKKTKNIYLISSIIGHNSIKKTKRTYTYMNEEDYIGKLYNLNTNKDTITEKKKHKRLFKRGNLLGYRKDTLKDTMTNK